MKIYEFQCESCRLNFEKPTFNGCEEDGFKCPKCKNKAVKRVVGPNRFFSPVGACDVGNGSSGGFT
ncbi:MAG: FmdB family zinc ribbon protein [Thermodesulfobacteriota bacterium]